MRYKELIDDYIHGKPPSNARNYIRSGGNKQQFKWRIELNNGKVVLRWADTRYNAVHDQLSTNQLIIGVKSAVKVKLAEISPEKATFVRKLKDPGAQEIHEVLDYMRSEFKDWRFSARIGDNSPGSASLYCEYQEHTHEPEEAKRMGQIHSQMINGAKYAVITLAEHWAWDQWASSAAGTTCYLLRKT